MVRIRAVNARSSAPKAAGGWPVSLFELEVGGQALSIIPPSVQDSSESISDNPWRENSEHLIDLHLFRLSVCLCALFVLVFMAPANSWTPNIDRNLHSEYSDIYKCNFRLLCFCSRPLGAADWHQTEESSLFVVKDLQRKFSVMWWQQTVHSWLF